MSCGVRVRLADMPAGLGRDLARLGGLWNEGLRRFGGPFLAGKSFCAVDAFFAPVAFRIQTYGIALDVPAAAYALRLLALDSMQAWYADALAETFPTSPTTLKSPPRGRCSRTCARARCSARENSISHPARPQPLPV